MAKLTLTTIFQGFYFYDGHKKACTLYSNVDDGYFKGHFCAEAKHKTREETNDKETFEFSRFDFKFFKVPL